METYKLIRKICLWLIVIWAVGLLGFLAFEIYESCAGNYGCSYNLQENFGHVVILCIGIYIGVFILFEIISKIIESVKKDSKKMKIFSDKKYLEAFSEVEENNIQSKELWAKAFAQCGGDKEKQKSIYVELRTKELSKG